jgi:hypothetical protein
VALDKPQDAPTLPEWYYRQKAAEARQAAEEATTRAIKERLHGSARGFDKLADAAESRAYSRPARDGDPEATMKRPAKRSLANRRCGCDRAGPWMAANRR